MLLKRVFDIIFAIAIGILLLPIIILISICIKISSTGSVLYWSKRIGRNNVIFLMPKFRTMRIDTPQVATHLLDDPDRWLTSIGKFLRSSSLDEIPQLWNILKGDMSVIGPRPALFNQNDLIKLRTDADISQLVPGLSGWAQINGRDDISIEEKVKLDKFYKDNLSFYLDLKILFLTLFKVVKKEGVKH